MRTEIVSCDADGYGSFRGYASARRRPRARPKNRIEDRPSGSGRRRPSSRVARVRDDLASDQARRMRLAPVVAVVSSIVLALHGRVNSSVRDAAMVRRTIRWGVTSRRTGAWLREDASATSAKRAAPSKERRTRGMTAHGVLRQLQRVAKEVGAAREIAWGRFGPTSISASTAPAAIILPSFHPRGTRVGYAHRHTRLRDQTKRPRVTNTNGRATPLSRWQATTPCVPGVRKGEKSPSLWSESPGEEPPNAADVAGYSPLQTTSSLHRR